MYYYKYKRILFIWKCERIHTLWGLRGIGYGFTKKQARLNSWRLK